MLRAPSRVADTALGVVIPLHAHLGMTSVIEDYVNHRKTRTALKTALSFLTAATIVCAHDSFSVVEECIHKRSNTNRRQV